MKQIIFLLLMIVGISSLSQQNVKFSSLPLNTTPSTIVPNDSFPYVQDFGPAMKRMKINDILGIPVFVNKFALYAPINNPTFTGTVSGINKSMVGLGNVDNTSDLNKPISTAVQTALDLKADSADVGDVTNKADKTYVDAEGSIQHVATSSGTLVLTASSPRKTVFTGSTTHTLRFPALATMQVGQYFEVFNVTPASTITLQTSDLTTLGQLSAARFIRFTKVDNSNFDIELPVVADVINDIIDVDNTIIRNLKAPVNLNDAANKTYVDAFGGARAVVTAASTTTLLVTDPRDTVAVGSTTHTFKLPSTSLLQVGNTWRFVNRSTGAITIQNASNATILTVPAQQVAQVRVSNTAAETFFAYTHPIYSSVDGTLSVGGVKITNLATPTASTDAATKGYVDTAVSGGGGGTPALVARASKGGPTTLGGTVPFSDEDYDPDNIYDPILQKMTIPAGYVGTATGTVTAQFYFATNNGAAFIQYLLYKNGVLYKYGSERTGSGMFQTTPIPFEGVAGDYFELYQTVSGGGTHTLGVGYGAGSNWISYYINPK